MKRNTVTIENGTVSVPPSGNVRMTASEIAALLGVYEQTVRAHIKAILRDGVVREDTSGPLTVTGNTLMPDFHGLEMITALAFRVHSPQAELFRAWVVRRITVSPPPTNFIIRLPSRSLAN
jgi:hypothetical protein